tara:strand:+ start:7975 stop:8682 length:708 start_codon:yes stop_codon:yes gene_type:complete
MKVFADTSNLDDIKMLNDLSLIQGVTTNPTLMMKEIQEQKKTKQPGDVSHWHEIVVKICETVCKPVSAEVTSTTVGEMVEEGKLLSELNEHVVVKLPCTPDGIHACRVLTEYMDIKVNMTLCFSVAQAVLASNASAEYISPFVGRMDDYSAGSGVKLVRDIQNAYINADSVVRNGAYTRTKILAASIRNVEHFNQVAEHADVATCPPKVIWDIFRHKLTLSGLEQFDNDWKKTNE